MLRLASVSVRYVFPWRRSDAKSQSRCKKSAGSGRNLYCERIDVEDICSRLVAMTSMRLNQISEREVKGGEHKAEACQDRAELRTNHTQIPSLHLTIPCERQESRRILVLVEVETAFHV